MKVLILNGDSGSVPDGLDTWLKSLGSRLTQKGHQVRELRLRDLGIKRCLGCWSCWWAEPGICVHKDGMEDVLRQSLEAELLVWGVPLALGAQSALVKHCQDRMIPLVHPYITLVGGESHHRARYAHYPRQALVMSPGPGDGPADLELTASLFSRFALNMKSSLDYWTTTATVPEEAADATLGA